MARQSRYPTESAATLRLQLDNSKAPTEFQLYQIGVYAKLVDGETEVLGETLLQVMQYEQPDIVRAIPHISEFVVNTLMGQADKVEGIIDLAAYVSIRQFSNAVDSIEQSINLVDGKISDHCLDMDDPHNTTAEQVTTLSGDSVETSLSKKAALASPALTGTPTVNGAAIATATKPAEHPLPLADGFEIFTAPLFKCSYSKAQDGLVVLHVAVNTVDGTTPPDWRKIAQLPVGYLPDGIISINYDNEAGGGGKLTLYTNGRLEVAFATNGVIVGTLCYYASGAA